MANQKCFEISAKICKVFAYLLTFVIVLGSGVVSKGTLLFMTSQIRQDKIVTYCNRDLGTYFKVIKNFSRVTTNYLGREKQFIVKLPEAERVAWIWCIFFAFIVPQLGSTFRACRMCFFKSSKKPTSFQFLLVFVMETMHTIGIAILVLFILPDLDVVKGAMLTNCLSFVPGVLGN